MKCVECGRRLKVGVYKSHAGWYVGYVCEECGPFSRISTYFQNKDEAERCKKENYVSLIGVSEYTFFY